MPESAPPRVSANTRFRHARYRRIASASPRRHNTDIQAYRMPELSLFFAFLFPYLSSVCLLIARSFISNTARHPAPASAKRDILLRLRQRISSYPGSGRSSLRQHSLHGHWHKSSITLSSCV